MIRMALCTLLLAPVLGVPAMAQESPVSTQILLAGSRCGDMSDSSDNNLVIATCNGAIAELDRIKSASTLNGHETNLYWVMIAAAHTSIGSRMGAIDGARTARVCGELEKAWVAYVKVNPGLSPPDYAGDMTTMKKQAVGPVTLCRTEFDAPAGAPPLP